jgi:hypothetical protein
VLADGGFRAPHSQCQHHCCYTHCLNPYPSPHFAVCPWRQSVSASRPAAPLFLQLNLYFALTRPTTSLHASFSPRVSNRIDPVALASQCVATLPNQNHALRSLLSLTLLCLDPPFPYRIDPVALASECQRKYACSTTVGDLPGKNNPGQEVILQVGYMC